MPPASRGALFEKTAPLDPPQKLLIKGGHDLQLFYLFSTINLTIEGKFNIIY